MCAQIVQQQKNGPCGHSSGLMATATIIKHNIDYKATNGGVPIEPGVREGQYKSALSYFDESGQCKLVLSNGARCSASRRSAASKISKANKCSHLTKDHGLMAVRTAKSLAKSTISPSYRPMRYCFVSAFS
jgi:hypothetical protein